jgi:sterol desaturase/sphingolipid hydroxylase (fatty acid hydroxylase superfamily)
MPGAIETPVRLGFFLGVLLIMALWEGFAPRRRLTVRKTPRWISNLALVALNALLVRLIMPITAIGAAVVAESRGWGLLHLVDWSAWLEIVLAVTAFDLAIYLQHVMFHAVPALWRLHMVHHADKDFDVTTGSRFHTMEILLSAFIKLGVVAVVGPSTMAVLIFEILLNATSMFNHSNVRMPSGLDRLLRWFVVTPDMHRVHHSVLRYEANSNFGFNLPWWDFLLGTYRAQPALGHEGMTIGISSLRSESQVERLLGMLLLPFRGNPGPYPINRQDGQTSIGDQRLTPKSDSLSEGAIASEEQPANPMDSP